MVLPHQVLLENAPPGIVLAGRFLFGRKTDCLRKPRFSRYASGIMSHRLDPAGPPAKLYLRTTHATRQALKQIAKERTAREKNPVKVTDLLREAVDSYMTRSRK